MNNQDYIEINSLDKLRASRIELNQRIEQRQKQLAQRYIGLSRGLSLGALNAWVSEQTSNILSLATTLIAAAKTIVSIIKIKDL